jgi:hypothetical protein
MKYGLPGAPPLIPLLKRLRRLRRRRSLEYFSSRPWRRNARRRDASRQSGAAKGLRNRTLQRRRARLLFGSAKADRRGAAFKRSFNDRTGSSNGQPKLRDQLCLLIRQHNLDPTLVKAYAADFCGTETIKDASRDLVESFIAHISTSAKEDLDGLICKLNSYSRPAEVSQ